MAVTDRMRRSVRNDIRGRVSCPPACLCRPDGNCQRTWAETRGIIHRTPRSTHLSLGSSSRLQRSATARALSLLLTRCRRIGRPSTPRTATSHPWSVERNTHSAAFRPRQKISTGSLGMAAAYTPATRKSSQTTRRGFAHERRPSGPPSQVAPSARRHCQPNPAFASNLPRAAAGLPNVLHRHQRHPAPLYGGAG
jgi:hypothetical protein